jgi:hypothetical protein
MKTVLSPEGRLTAAHCTGTTTTRLCRLCVLSAASPPLAMSLVHAAGPLFPPPLGCVPSRPTPHSPFPLSAQRKKSPRAPSSLSFPPRKFPFSQSRRQPPHSPPSLLDRPEHRSPPSPHRISTKTTPKHCSLLFQYPKSFSDTNIPRNSLIFPKSIENKLKLRKLQNKFPYNHLL